MSKFIYDLIGSLIMFYANIYVWSKLLDIRINYNKVNFYISWLAISILSILNTYVFSDFIRITSLTLMFMIFIFVVFKVQVKQAIVTPLFSQFMVMISEGICVLLLAIIFKLDLNELKEKFLLTIFVNILTSIIYITMLKIPIFIKIYKKLLNSIDKLSKEVIMFFSLIIIVIANILTALTYTEVDIKFLIFINLLFSIICAIIVFNTLRVKNDYNNVSNNYNVAIRSLNDYEEMMNKYRIENHENKNLLLTIRAMLLNKEKDIPKYIDSIVEEKYNDNEKLMKKINIIPSGGLRGTIYSEIMKIQENTINYSLNIENSVKTVDLIKINTDTIVDICKIIGVFIDNSIDEVKHLKQKTIEISLYVEDSYLSIRISNNFDKKIDVNKIFNEGYTTKGSGHGYGLPLVKKLIESNKLLSNRIEINGNIFSQILLINICN